MSETSVTETSSLRLATVGSSRRVHFSDDVKVYIVKRYILKGGAVCKSDDGSESETSEDSSNEDLGLSRDDEAELDEYIRMPEDIHEQAVSATDQEIDMDLSDDLDDFDHEACAPEHGDPFIASDDAQDPVEDTTQIDSTHKRKHTVLYATPSSVHSAMETWVEHEMSKFESTPPFTECWIHPTAAHLTILNVIAHNFSWRNERGRLQTLSLQLGTVMLLLAGLLTDVMKRGYVEGQWHLSHLCGNWACCNYTHFTLEPGSVNVSRNTCFRSSGYCRHQPQCMKDKILSSAMMVPEEIENVEMEGVVDFEKMSGGEDDFGLEGNMEFPPNFFELDA